MKFHKALFAGFVALIVSASAPGSPAHAQLVAAPPPTVKVPTYSSLGLSMAAAGNDSTRYWLYYERSNPAAHYAVTVQVHGLALPGDIHWQLPRRARPSSGSSGHAGDITVHGDRFFRSTDEVRKIDAGMIPVSLPTFRVMAEQGTVDRREPHHVRSVGLPLPITTYLDGGLSGQGVLYTMRFGDAFGVSTSIGSGSAASPFSDDCRRTANGIVVGLFAMGGTPLPPDRRVSVSSQGKAVAAGRIALDRRAPRLGLFDATLPASAMSFTVSWGGMSETMLTKTCLG